MPIADAQAAAAPVPVPTRPQPERVISDREWEVIKAMRVIHFTRTSRPRVLVLNWTGSQLVVLDTSQVT